MYHCCWLRLVVFEKLTLIQLRLYAIPGRVQPAGKTAAGRHINEDVRIFGIFVRNIFYEQRDEDVVLVLGDIHAASTSLQHAVDHLIAGGTASLKRLQHLAELSRGERFVAWRGLSSAKVF